MPICNIVRQGTVFTFIVNLSLTILRKENRAQVKNVTKKTPSSSFFILPLSFSLPAFSYFFCVLSFSTVTLLYLKTQWNTLKSLYTGFKNHHNLSIAKSVPLLAVLRLRLGLCCVEMHYGTVLEDDFLSSFRRNLLPANKRSNSIPKIIP